MNRLQKGEKRAEKLRRRANRHGGVAALRSRLDDRWERSYTRRNYKRSNERRESIRMDGGLRSAIMAAITSLIRSAAARWPFRRMTHRGT